MIPKRHLPQRITFEGMVGQGAEGEVWGTPVTGIPARVELEQKLVRDANGAETLSTATVHLRPASGVTLAGRITLPDGSVRRVINVAEFVGRRRVEIVTAYVE